MGIVNTNKKKCVCVCLFARTVHSKESSSESITAYSWQDGWLIRFSTWRADEWIKFDWTFFSSKLRKKYARSRTYTRKRKDNNITTTIIYNDIFYILYWNIIYIYDLCYVFVNISHRQPETDRQTHIERKRYFHWITFNLMNEFKKRRLWDL